MITIIILMIIAITAYWIRYSVEHCKNHNIHIKLDGYGSIQVFDNSLELIALVYKDRTIEYQREISFWKASKIKNVSDHFELYKVNLMERDSICL